MIISRIVHLEVTAEHTTRNIKAQVEKVEVQKAEARLFVESQKLWHPNGLTFDKNTFSGNEIVLRGTAFTSGNTKSCGCLSKEVKKAKRLPNNQGVINHIILQYKRHARDRNLSWNLTYEQVEKIIQEPCFYCGAEKSNHKVTKNCKEGYDHNGIDRIDSSVVYEPNNVVSCCKICNHAKSNLTKDDFINWAIRVAEHSKAMAEQWG